MLKLTTLTLCSLYLFSCQTEQLYMSKNFTEPGTFTEEAEGPAVDIEGNLYAVSYSYKETIGKVTPDGKSSIFIKMPAGSTANGIRFSSKQEMYIADYTGHNILKVNQKGKVSIFAHSSSMNQPNDLAIMDNDILFASDPDWSEGTGQLWRISKNGETTCIEKNMGTTNGIEVSPDQKKLYVNESKQLNLWVYDLSDDGEISNKQLLYKFKDGGLDGMRCDSLGNLYVSRWGNGEIAVISPAGKLVRTVRLNGRKPTNIAFGGPDGQTAYITLADTGNIEKFRVEHPGRSWVMRQKKEDL